MRRNHVASTLIRRHFRTKYPLGYDYVPITGFRGFTDGFPLLRMFSVAISVSLHVYLILD